MSSAKNLVVLLTTLLAACTGLPLDSSNSSEPAAAKTLLHGERKAGDRSLILRNELVLEGSNHTIRLENKREVITYVVFNYSSTDKERLNCTLEVVEGGQGHNYVVVGFTSESGKIMISYQIYGYENNTRVESVTEKCTTFDYRAAIRNYVDNISFSWSFVAYVVCAVAIVFVVGISVVAVYASYIVRRAEHSVFV